MPFQPGSPASIMPGGDDALIRRIQELERQMRELGPSIAGSFRDIGNELLKNPITTGSNYSGADGFALPSAWTELTACSIVIPAGYTRMSFDAIGWVLARNNVGSTQYLMTRVLRTINGGDTRYSVQDQQTVPNGFWATSLVPYKYSEVVAPGDVHRFSVTSWVGGGTWTAHVDHVTRLDVSAIFTR